MRGDETRDANSGMLTVLEPQQADIRDAVDRLARAGVHPSHKRLPALHHILLPARPLAGRLPARLPPQRLHPRGHRRRDPHDGLHRSTSTYAANDEAADPLLDLNHQEEQELPSLTVATLGTSDKVVVLVCEARVQVGRLEGMLAVGVDGCKQVRQILDTCVREKGKRMIREGAVEKGVGIGDMDIDG
jgi:hypothetical protein